MASMNLSLTEKLRAMQSTLRDTPVALVPASFDPSDRDMLAYPLPLGWQWESLKAALKSTEVRGVLVRLPLFWQVERAVFDACKAAGSYPFINDVGNIPVGIASIADAAMDCVLTTAEDARAFASAIRDRGTPAPKLWFVIWRFDQSPAPLALPGTTVHEVHMCPGVPVLTQCKDLADNGRSFFHALVPGKEYPLQADNPSLPPAIQREGICTCGEITYAYA